VTEREIRGDNEELLGTVPMLSESEEYTIYRDGPTFEVVDVADFIWHESARELQPFQAGGAQHVFHRGWYSFEQLKMLEKDGFFSNVDELKESRDFDDEYQHRYDDLFKYNRTKDLIEVLEYWCYKDGQVHRTIIGNRHVLLRDEETSPFWHGEYPFVVASTMPEAFRIAGTSDVEMVMHLQEMLWELMNQRVDNLKVINNAITLVRNDVEDADAFNYAPGARWPVDDPKQVEWWTPPYQLASITLDSEALLKGELQNVAGGALFAGGDSGSIDQKTATGATLVMSAAQKRMAHRKFNVMQSLADATSQALKLAQQFVHTDRLVHIIGQDGAVAFESISPTQLQGDYVVELEPMTESMFRQERRAEATTVAQVIAQLAPLAAVGGTPVNAKAVVEHVLKAFDINDTEKFFTQVPAAGMAAALGGGGGGGGAPVGDPTAPPGGPNMGTTAASAVDASSPSATGGMSMSPEMMLQRALAMTGGAANAGVG
jgi:hypothetical protein